MNETRTPQERYAAWVRAVNICHEKGWKYVEGWVFMSPDGKGHDLSAADLTKLDEIERKGLFATN